MWISGLIRIQMSTGSLPKFSEYFQKVLRRWHWPNKYMRQETVPRRLLQAQIWIL